MKRRILAITIAVLVVGLVTWALALPKQQTASQDALTQTQDTQEPQEATAAAQNRAELEAQDSGCSNRTLKGKYGIRFKGDAPGFGPFVAVAIGEYDGRGHIFGHGTANINGKILEGEVTGTFRVRSDCTAVGEISYALGGFSVKGTAVLVDGGKEGYFIATSPAPVIMEGSLKKL